MNFDFANGATTVVGDVTFTASAGSFTIQSDSNGVLKIGDIDNQSTALQIFDLELEFQNKETVLAGGPVQFNQAITTKTGNTELTFSGNSEIIAGNNNIFDGSIDLFLNGTTLDLSDTTQFFSSISVSGDSIIDCGGASAALNLNILSVLGGTLTVKNWTGNPGDFAVSGAVDSTSLGNIIFEGWGDATWDPTSGVLPAVVPESSTCGGYLVMASLAFHAWRRRHRSR
ncbi:MAG: hypothetical protein J6386_11115 [Candidatus Synoicihabitans palmerolidicus]|nr:hypothetical protein [Candidatus Synoicihabitans palmerolidicus]